MAANDTFNPVGIIATDVLLVKKQIAFDDRLSDAARTMLLKISLICCEGARMFTKGELLQAYRGGLSDRKYKRVMSELELLGYVVRHRYRTVDGRRFAGMVMTLGLPDLPTEFLEKPLSKDEYLAIRGICKTPDEVNKHVLGRKSVEERSSNQSFQSFPSSSQQARFGTVEIEEQPSNQSFPSSSQQARFGTVEPDSPRINKQTLLVTDKPTVNHEVVSNKFLKTKNGNENEVMKVNEVCLFMEAESRQTGKGQLFASRVASGERHVLKNCTEKQAQDVFEMVAGKCLEKKFAPEQYCASRVKIDELLEGDRDYQERFFETLKRFCYGDGSSKNVSKTPSFWINDDFGDLVRMEALNFDACRMGVFS